MWFQHDGVPVQYGEDMQQWLNMTYPGRWIGCRGLIAWLLWSLSLSIFLWRHLKDVYVRTIEDLLTCFQVVVAVVDANMLRRVQENDVWCTVICHEMNQGHMEHLL